MKKLKEVMFNVAIILISALVFFVLTLLIIQKYDNLTAVNQIYAIAGTNAMFGIGAGATIIGIIYHEKSKETLIMIATFVMFLFTFLFFALGLATINVTEVFLSVAIILLLITMFMLFVVCILTIKRETKKLEETLKILKNIEESLTEKEQ